MSGRIAIILPRRERFSLSRFGAIALTVDDYVRHSALRDETEILGLAVEDPRNGAFRAVEPRDAFWRRRTLGFAEGCAAHLAPAPPRNIDVHNRVEAFHRLAHRFPEAAVSLWLHNDPQTMRGAKSARERRRILARARFVFCVSAWVRARFLDGVSEGAERVLVFPCAIDTACDPTGDGGAEAATPGKEPLILYVGRVIPEKGALTFAEAVAEALPKLPGWRALMIGGGAEGAYADKVAAAMKRLGPRAEWRDFVPHAAVMEAFRRAAIAVIPSAWDEPFGRTALEAMTAGAAVIATRRGGLPEIVGDAGLMLEPATTVRLVEMLTTLAGDDAARADWQRRAKARAGAEFDIRAWAAKLDKLRV